MSKIPTFYNHRGRLSSYAFACGSVEKWENGEDRLILSREHSVYHLRGFISGKHVSESFPFLAIARKRKTELTEESSKTED